MFQLSVRARNVLRENGIDSIAKLRRYRFEDLLKFRNCGLKTIQEIAILNPEITTQRPKITCPHCGKALVIGIRRCK